MVSINSAYDNCEVGVLKVKALLGAFNQEKATVGAFFVIVETDG